MSHNGYPAAVPVTFTAGHSQSDRMAFLGNIRHHSAPARSLGLLLLGLSFPSVGLAVREFSRVHTAFDVREPTTALIQTGVFRFSRNPLYFAMMLLCPGTALVVNSLTMVVVSLAAGSALCI